MSKSIIIVLLVVIATSLATIAGVMVKQERDHQAKLAEMEKRRQTEQEAGARVRAEAAKYLQ